MKKYKEFILPAVVFLTGACVLVIEVVATRILSPYYGNTIFTVSSVIGVVLAALSVGYYFGGKLADKFPFEKYFYSIIFVSGLSVVLLQILIQFALPYLGYFLSILSGPLISALLLFFIPSLLLGTLSPYAIKLQKQYFPKKGLGSISGEIFFWSTLGSIFGSLFSGFILIPRFGINQIIMGVSIILILLGLFPLILLKTYKKKQSFKIIALSIISIFTVGLISRIQLYNVVYSHDGMYEKINIFDGESDGKLTRFLLLDRSSSAAMYLNSDELVYDYSKYYVLYKFFKPEIENALVIGGGAYSLPKVLIADLPTANVDVSEIEPALYDLAIKYFRLKETNRLTNYTEDGRRFLHDTNKKYDLIFSDVYSSLYSIPAHFTTVEFFNIAKEKLNQDGLFMANIIGDFSRQKTSFLLSEIKTFRSVFPNSYFFAVDSINKIGPQNIIFVGFNSNKIVDFTDLKLSQADSPIIRSLNKKVIDLNRFDLSYYPILTDNYSPVDYLISKVVRDKFNEKITPDGDEMMALIRQQLGYGSRYLSAEGHTKVQNFLISEIRALSDEVSAQSWQYKSPGGQEYELTNIIGRFDPFNQKRIILATHYDSKKIVDKDKNNIPAIVPGANDPASGAAVLLEIARIISNSPKKPTYGLDIIFFDGGEGDESISRDYTNWKPLGSVYFSEHLNDLYRDDKPTGAIVLDMVCDKDLKIYKEKTSFQEAPSLTNSFWNVAKDINKNIFVDKIGLEIKRDQMPLNQVGVPSTLIIDADYPFFHTSQDNLDKCSSKSLETVAKAIISYLYSL